MLDKMYNAALSATLRTKAAAALKIMVDGETNQNAINPRVIPYVADILSVISVKRYFNYVTNHPTT